MSRTTSNLLNMVSKDEDTSMKIFGKHGQHYQSELEQFMRDFDEKRHVEPVACLEERMKHESIADKRDNKVDPSDSKIWEGF